MAEFALSSDAEADLAQTAAYTLKQWGVAQMEQYVVSLTFCFESMARGAQRSWSDAHPCRASRSHEPCRTVV